MTSLSQEQLHELSGLLQKAASGQMPVRGQHFEILGKFGSVGEAASAARLLSAAEMPQLMGVRGEAEKSANAPFQGLMATPGGGFTMLGGAQDGNALAQLDYSTLSPEHRAQLDTALEAYAPMANDTAEQHLPQVMQHHTTGRNVGGLAGLTLGGIAGGVDGRALAGRMGAGPMGKLVASAMGAVAVGLGGGYLGNRIGEGFDRRAAMPIAQENADFSHEMARNAAAERQRLDAAGQKTASLAYSAGSTDALASLGIEKEAFVQAVGAGLAAGARALAPHVGKAVQGVATAGRRLGTGLGQAWQAASPHMQQAGAAIKTTATNAYNTAKPVVQNAFNKAKGFAGGAAMESGIPGAISATNQKRMY